MCSWAGAVPSCAASRRRKSLTNDRRGATGAIGSRKSSNGSVVIAPPFCVHGTEGIAGSYQECLGGMHRAAEMVGHFGHRQAVEVAQRQRAAVVRAELLQHGMGVGAFESQVDVVVDVGFVVCQQAEPALLS